MRVQVRFCLAQLAQATDRAGWLYYEEL
jgi:hypothetical protein